MASHDDTSAPVGSLSVGVGEQYDSIDKFTTQVTIQYTKNDFHLAPTSLFGQLNIMDPALSIQFASDYTWQTQLGWTVLKHSWSGVAGNLDVSLQQAVGYQFAQQPDQQALVLQLLQGQADYTVPKVSFLHVQLSAGMVVERSGTGKWTGRFQSNLASTVQCVLHF